MRTLRQDTRVASVVFDETRALEADDERTSEAAVLKLSGRALGLEAHAMVLASDAALPEALNLVALGDPKDELVDATIRNWAGRALQAEARAKLLEIQLSLHDTFPNIADARDE